RYRRRHSGRGRLAQDAFCRQAARQGQARRTESGVLLVGRRNAVLAIHLVRQGRDGRSYAAAAQGSEGDDQVGSGFEEIEMKASAKAKRRPKRDLFAELSEGMVALAEARKGKRTLRTHTVEFKPAPEVTPEELVRVRERLRLSRALFAVYLRTNVRTLENW